jgi:hypothetical protein
VIAHVLLSRGVDRVSSPASGGLNGLAVGSDNRGAITIDPTQRKRLAEYWGKRVAKEK